MQCSIFMEVKTFWHRVVPKKEPWSIHQCWLFHFMIWPLSITTPKPNWNSVSCPVNTVELPSPLQLSQTKAGPDMVVLNIVIFHDSSKFKSWHCPNNLIIVSVPDIIMLNYYTQVLRQKSLNRRSSPGGEADSTWESSLAVLYVYTIQLNWFPAVGLYSVYIVHCTVCTLCTLYSVYTV